MVSAPEPPSSARGSRSLSLLACQPDEIVFTSGGTEASNLAIRGVLERAFPRRHIVTSTVEHPATSSSCNLMERHGVEVTRLPVDVFGRVLVDEARPFVRSDTALVTIMLAQTGWLADAHSFARKPGPRARRPRPHRCRRHRQDPDARRRAEMTSSPSRPPLYAPSESAFSSSGGALRRAVLVGAGRERGLRPGTGGVSSSAWVQPVSWRPRPERRGESTTLQDGFSDSLRRQSPRSG